MVTTTSNGPIDCACVIHGDLYSWEYVERLYSMLNRNITPGIRLHVYTEAFRPVPAPMIKHDLIEWNITRNRRGWWYKMQLFNSAHHSGPLLYFDLDTVIVGNIDWIWQQPTKYFWAIRDFKYLWDSKHTGINSSIMYWDTQKYQCVWDNFLQENVERTIQKYRGDQDYISFAIEENQRRFFDVNKIQSRRWQCLDGGYDFDKKRHKMPGQGTKFTNDVGVLIFHGDPKPDQLNDEVVVSHWQ
jgi:hypothetical protein